jgi:hypothetical protein
MIISIPKRASSFNTYYSDEWSTAMTDEEEMCSECSSGSSWPLSISTDEEHGRVRHEAITLREAVAARKTRIPNPEALSRSDSSISLRIPTKLGKKDRNRYNVRMRPFVRFKDSHIFRRVGATYQATENVSPRKSYTHRSKKL